MSKTSTVTLTITNHLPGSISDIEIRDAALTPGRSGRIVTGTIDTPVESGSSYRVSYNDTAEKTGSSTPGAAQVTFADATGNYQKLSSDTVTVTVL